MSDGRNDCKECTYRRKPEEQPDKPEDDLPYFRLFVVYRRGDVIGVRRGFLVLSRAGLYLFCLFYPDNGGGRRIVGILGQESRE